LARIRILSTTAARDDTASSLATSPSFSAAPSPESLGPALRGSHHQQIRRPSEQAEKLQKFLSILHEAIDLINEDDDVSSWL
jgi:hypothetical protein